MPSEDVEQAAPEAQHNFSPRAQPALALARKEVGFRNCGSRLAAGGAGFGALP